MQVLAAGIDFLCGWQGRYANCMAEGSYLVHCCRFDLILTLCLKKHDFTSLCKIYAMFYHFGVGGDILTF